MSRKFNYSEWKQKRKELGCVFGSSDAPAAVGESPYKSRAQLFFEKTGQLTPDDANNDFTLWGRCAEPAVAQYYQGRTGNKVRKIHQIMQHEKYPFMIASLDYESGPVIVEVKSTSRWAHLKNWGEEWSDEIPFPVMIQVIHQMSVSGKREAHIPVTVGGGVPKIYRVFFNVKIEAQIIELEMDLYQRIQKLEPPPFDFDHPATPDLIKALYGIDESLPSIDLDESANALVGLYQALGERENEAKKKRAAAKAEIISMMKHAAVGLLPDGRAITRKEIERKGFTVEPTSYVDFRIKDQRGKRSLKGSNHSSALSVRRIKDEHTTDTSESTEGSDSAA